MVPPVSVALCTRNGARFIQAQVASICAQQPPPRQIVLSDDGSSDGSVELAQATIAASPIAGSTEVTVLRNASLLGVTRNFQQAMQACRHELIALSDQDDVWHPGRLARMTAPFVARPELLLLHSDARLVDAALAPLGTTLFQALAVQPAELAAIADGRAFEVLLRRNLVTGATTLVRRSLLQAALPFAPEWVHDEWLAAIAAATGRMDVLPEPTIDYRQHGGNQIGARPLGWRDKLAKAMDSRGSKHDERLRRAEALLERLLALGSRVSPAIVQAQREKVAHQRFRAALPAARAARVVPVLREAVIGRYQRFGRGGYAIAQDLLERA